MKLSLAKCRNFNLHAKLHHIHNKKMVTKQIKHNLQKLSTLLNRSVQPKIYKVPVHFHLFSAQLSLKVLLEYSPSQELNLSLHQFHQSQHCNKKKSCYYLLKSNHTVLKQKLYFIFQQPLLELYQLLLTDAVYSMKASSDAHWNAQSTLYHDCLFPLIFQQLPYLMRVSYFEVTVT